MVAHALVLGAEGMLGAQVARRLRHAPGVRLSATGRAPSPGSDLLSFVVGRDDPGNLLDAIGPVDYLINCIALTKHKIRDEDPDDRMRAIQLNAEFPNTLATIAAARGTRIVQISTDCVFSGARGRYHEGDPHDGHDVYGKTKSLGEVPGEHVLNVRSSLIGRDRRKGDSLVEWLLAYPLNAEVPGFVDHHWNGVTSSVFADLVAGLVAERSTLAGTFHLVPADAVDKATLLSLICARYARRDLKIVPTRTDPAIDRSLTTRHPEINDRLWSAAGFSEPPRISDLVRAMSD